MPEHTHTFKYQIGDTVVIQEINTKARIDIIQLNCLGTEYRVTYWINGERKSTWIYPEEIE